MKQNKPCMNPHILLICVHDGESSIRNNSIVVVSTEKHMRLQFARISLLYFSFVLAVFII